MDFWDTITRGAANLFSASETGAQENACYEPPSTSVCEAPLPSTSVCEAQQSNANDGESQPDASIPFRGMYDGAGGTTGGIEVCNRDADGVPLQETFDWQHYWLRTPQTEAGMNPAEGGDPGYSGGFLSETAIRDHTGAGRKSDATCRPVEQYDMIRGYPPTSSVPYDQECVNQELQSGRATGKWVPFMNDCRAEVDAILETCRKDRDAAILDQGAGYE